jgi:hypothetical protein
MPRAGLAFLIAICLLAPGLSRVAAAQCMLANPSFEIAGSAGATFGGWNQFGAVGSSTLALHGAKAARVSGPNTGNWAVSGLWQRFDSVPGDRWSAAVQVRPSSSRPLLGGCRAILNIEWRDGSDNLISYESHEAATPSTPADQYQPYAVVSAPAPAGTATARLLLGVLQSPTDPSPDVVYDLATFDKVGPPSLDDLQWGDFNGGRTVQFSGRSWRVKGPGYYGPGPNLFCDSPSCTWVDAAGRLHLTHQQIGGAWYATEVALVDALGYGDYVFTTVGRLDQIDPAVVFGLFLWQYGACYDPAYLWWNPYNEIDIEFSRWGVPGNAIAQFVAQPYDWPGNLDRFDATFATNERTSHAFRWLADRVEFRSWRGGPGDESPASLIHEWTYTGPHIPRPDQPRVHLNLWRPDTPPATYQEVVLDTFAFRPDGAVVGVPGDPGIVGSGAGLAFARPNPFRDRTVIHFVAAQAATVELAVFDIAGRRVRTLLRGAAAAGEHDAPWDGLDDAGRRVAPGVYLYRLQLGERVAGGRLVLLH